MLIPLRYFGHEWKKHSRWNTVNAFLKYLEGPGLEEISFNKKERKEFLALLKPYLASGKVIFLLDGWTNKEKLKKQKRKQ